MLRGLLGVVDGEKALPFVRLFFGRPSQHLWEDDSGDVHAIQQGEGGKQGDALMPLLHSLGEHHALDEVVRGLVPTEKLFAFLDDVCLVTTPDKIATVYNLLQ